MYKILNEEKIFEADVRAPRTRSTATAQGNTTEHARVTKLALPPPDPVKYELSWNGWDEFYDYWDKFVKEWYDTNANPKDPLTQSLESAFTQDDPKTQLNIKELPEPYYGNHKQAKAVIVNLNPGASGKNEHAKIIDKEGKNFLVQSFACECERKYSTYQEKWSMQRDSYEGYKDSHKVLGYDWWREANRINFFKRFWRLELADLFLLEACPYHSGNWTHGMERIEGHIVKKVITPALVLANCKKTCAVFVGSEFNKLISRIKGINKIYARNGTRKYKLYKATLPFTTEESGNDNEAYLLVINGVQRMRLPKDDVQNHAVEQEIKHKICEERMKGRVDKSLGT